MQSQVQSVNAAMTPNRRHSRSVRRPSTPYQHDGAAARPRDCVVGTQQARRRGSPVCRSIASGDAPMGGRSPRPKPHSGGRSAAGSSRHRPTCQQMNHDQHARGLDLRRG